MTTYSTQPTRPRTTVVDAGRPAVEQPRKSLSTWRRSDVLALVGSAGAALAITSLLFYQLTPMSGQLGFVVTAFAVFVAFYALLVSMEDTGPVVRDRIVAVVIHGLAFLVLLALGLIIGFTILRGVKALVHPNFFFQDMREAGPLQPLSVGGIAHAAVGTLEQISIALLVTVPLGVTCAVFLNEIPGAYSRFVRTIVEAMTALPSIICGLFIYATLILMLGFEKSGFAAAMALSLEMLPIIIRASDIVIRLVPGSLKEASYALGSSQWRTVWHVVLPTSRSGLTTAVILGTARGIGEAAPVLLTAGFTAALNANPFHGPQVSLPLAAFEFVKSPQQSFIQRGFGTAATLLLLVLFLFVLARVVGGRGPGALTSRQERRRADQSRADAARFASRSTP